MRLVPVVLLLILVLGVIAAVLISFGRAQQRERGLALRLEAVKELAWQHRDIEPELATALIGQIDGYQRRPRVHPAMFDELLDTAWRMREASPALSTIIIDEIRDGQRKALG